MKTTFFLTLSTLIMMMTSCEQSAKQDATATNATGTFGYDKKFILSHDTAAVVLGHADAQILISPRYQAKVFTSTTQGDGGRSLGWINYKAFDGPLDAHMNAYGGENRFWLGPEGGKYSLFFAKADSMTFDNWKTPAPIDSEAWDLVSASDTAVNMSKNMQIKNYVGTDLTIKVDRNIRLLNTKAINKLLNTNLPAGIKAVAYLTENKVTNAGAFAWNEKTGVPCTWILDMFPPSDQTTIIIPYKAGTGNPATTNYFGEISANRLKLDGQVLWFKADGKSRGKLGIHPERSKPVAGSYDSVNGILTIVLFDVDPTGKYLNQEWRTDRAAFSGDAVNAYNDGPLAEGKQMGPFYELESVSAAHFLAPGASSTHNHTVFHFTGSSADLSPIAQKVLGVDLSTLNKVF